MPRSAIAGLLIVLFALLVQVPTGAPTRAIGPHPDATGPSTHGGIPAAAVLSAAPIAARPHPASGPALPIWLNITSTLGSSPSARYEFGMANDPVDNVTLLFGGITKGFPWETYTWEYKAGAWSNVTSTAGTPPGPRAFPSLVYDAYDGYFLLFGGYYKSAAGAGATTYYYNDTWKFQFSAGVGTWSNITNWNLPAPEQMYYPTMAYDPVDQEAVMVGGGLGGLPSGNGAKPQTQTWVYHHGSWANLTTSLGTNQPATRDQAGMSWDPIDQELLLYGGNGQKSLLLNDTWTFIGNVWTNRSTAIGLNNPGGVRETFMAPDYGEGGYVVLFGGNPIDPGQSYANETWIFLQQNWIRITLFVNTTVAGVPLDPPTPRAQGGMVWDNGSKTVLLFGGFGQTTLFSLGSFSDTWTYRWSNITNAMVANRTQIPVNSGFMLTSVTHGGTWNYTYSYSSLPTGCSSSDVNVYICSPTGTGLFNVSLLVTDSHGAKAWSNISLTVYQPLTTSITISSNAIDQGHSVYINTTVVGGASSGGHTFAYTGLPPGCGGSNPNIICTPSSSAPQSRPYFINVTVHDSVNDVAVAGPVLLKVYPKLTLTVTGGPRPASNKPITLDAGSTLYLNSTPVGGEGNFTYVWTGLPVGCPAVNAASIACTPSPAGILVMTPFTANISVSDRTNTTIVAPISFNIWPQLVVNVTVSPLTGHSPVQVTFFGTVVGGEYPVSTTWIVGASANAQVNFTQKFTTGNYTAQFWANDTFGISEYREFNISVLPPLPKLTTSVIATPAGGIDAGQVAVFTASANGGLPPYTFDWGTGAGIPNGCVVTGLGGANLTCTPNGTAWAKGGTLYATVLVTDSLGSSLSSSASVKVYPPVHVSISESREASCGPTVVNLTAAVTGGVRPYTVGWTFPGGVTNTGTLASYDFTANGNFTVLANATDANLGSNSTSYSVVVAACPAGPGTTGQGFPVLTVLIVVIVLVAVVALAALLMRRRGGTPPSDEEPPAEEPVTEEGGSAEGAGADEYIYGSDRPTPSTMEVGSEEPPASNMPPADEGWPPQGEPPGDGN